MKKNEILFEKPNTPNSKGYPISSHIKAMSDLNGELFVEFCDGSKYAYDVSAIGGIDNVIDTFKKGSVTMTIGQVFYKYIRNAGCPCRRLS